MPCANDIIGTSLSSGLIYFWFSCLFLLRQVSSSENDLLKEQHRIWPARYTDAHRELHELVATTTHAHLHDFEIVIPSHADDDFNYISHEVRYRRPRRLRRDTDQNDVELSNLRRYLVSGMNQDYEIEVEPNSNLLASDFFVKTRSGSSEEELDHGEQAGCHYHGKLVSHNNQDVAISTCEGLTGLLRTSLGDVLIEPVSSQLNHSFQHPMQPHIMYHRHHLVKENNPIHFCGKRHKRKYRSLRNQLSSSSVVGKRLK